MSDNPRQFIAKRQSSNRHLDPFGELAFLMHALIVLLSPFALSITVFLRNKLGYRLSKPVLLALVVQWLLLLFVLVNLLSYGWFRLERDTPVGDYLQRLKITQLQQQLQQQQPAAAPESSTTTLPLPNGFDAMFPDNWMVMTAQQRQQWVRQHQVSPQRSREIQQQRMAALRQQQAAAQRRDEEMQKALADANAQAALEKKRPFIPHVALLVFAVAFLWLGIMRRREGARLIRQGWHTMSRGESYLSRLFPNMNEYRLQAYYEPALVFLLGALMVIGAVKVGFFLFTLGLWLMVAAVCLSLTEIVLMELALNEALDKQDAEVEARQYSDIRKAIRSSVENQRVASTGGIRGAMFDPETVAILRATAMGDAQEVIALSPDSESAPASMPQWVLAVAAFLVPVVAIALYMLLRH
jgi:hypothetical protein